MFYVGDVYRHFTKPIKKRQLLIRFKSAISQFCGRFIIQYALFKNISGFRGKCHEPT